ncbi:RNA pyrophosphohydrolase, partial [Burkholderia gladioli]
RATRYPRVIGSQPFDASQVCSEVEPGASALDETPGGFLLRD